MRLLLTFIFNTLFFHCHWSYGSSLSGEETYIHNNQLESAKYSSLPHTIFSPQGRLYNVEKNALMASDPTDVSSSLVVAIKYGSNSDNGGILMLSYKPNSPQLDFKNDGSDKKDKSLSYKDEPLQADAKSIKPLWTHDHHDEINDGTTTVSFPIMALPNKIVIGAGGNVADARALMNKIRDMSLHLFRHNDGMRSTHNVQGVSITSSMIAKMIADSMQLSTQDANASRMLASSALVVGYDGICNGEEVASRTIWRCDPTGQFFKCSFGAVGRGAGSAENKILQELSDWKSRKISSTENVAQAKILRLKNRTESSKSSNVSRDEVKEYFESMTFDDALVNVCAAIISALELKRNESSKIDKVLSGIQGVLLPLSKSRSTPVEQLHRGILKEAFQCAISSL